MSHACSMHAGLTVMEAVQHSIITNISTLAASIAAAAAAVATATGFAP